DDVRPELKLVKSVSGASQDLASNWTLTATGNGVALSGAGTTGALAPVPGGVAITLAETRGDFPGAGEFTDGTVWSCVDTANNDAAVAVTDSTVTLVSGQKVVCTIVNAHNGASPTVTKTAD